ncbi:MAG: tetratricopeptide repeat protein [Pseudomonadota bacterium]
MWLLTKLQLFSGQESVLLCQKRVVLVFLMMLSLFIADSAFAANLIEMRAERGVKQNKLVLDTDADVSYRIDKGASNTEFLITLNNTQLAYDIRQLNLRGTFVKTIRVRRAAGNLILAVQTSRDVTANGVVLVMPKGQGERLVVELAALDSSRQTAGNLEEIGAYVIELERSAQLYRGNLMTSPLVNNYQVYSVNLKRQGNQRYSLRVGFFDNQKDATPLLQQLSSLFPQARVINVTSQEKNNFIDKTKVAAARRDNQVKEDVRTRLELERERQAIETPDGNNPYEILLEEARQAMANEQYRKAIAIYGKLIKEAPNPTNQQAQEFIGIARQSNGQMAHAVAEYNTYLERYPEGQGAERIKQRLASINSLDDGLVTLKASDRTSQISRQAFNVYGSVSSFYRGASIAYDDGDSRNALAQFENYGDVVSKYRGNEYDLDMRFSGGYTFDFQDDDLGAGNFARVNYLYANAAMREEGHTLRVGRQRSKRGGILGRFDGAEAGYSINDQYKVNVVFGLPVDSSRQGVDADRYFLGANVDIFNFFNMDFNAFVIQQMFEGEIDRQAIGGEVRYSNGEHSVYSLIDFDINFAEFNAFLLNYNYLTQDRIHYNVNYSARKSPYLSTRNALFGQQTDDLDTVIANLGNDETLQDLALDRTYDSEALSLNMNLPLNEQYALNVGFSASYLSNNNGLATSADDTQVVISENEYRLSLQLVTQEVFLENLTLISGYELLSLEDSTVNSIVFKTSYYLSEEWRIQPNFRADWRTFDNGDSKSTYHPGLRMDYRVMKDLSLELDWNWYIYNDTFSDVDTESTYIQYMYLGGRYTF